MGQDKNEEIYKCDDKSKEYLNSFLIEILTCSNPILFHPANPVHPV